ncbi:MAG: SusC/RagA family TonB-linked outer membrane protein [Sphingobacteriales bacterium]|nr:MAG: SusC/RagA family TonB-linked outer membrane protein [Sphingobacteriales bacterium]
MEKRCKLYPIGYLWLTVVLVLAMDGAYAQNQPFTLKGKISADGPARGVIIQSKNGSLARSDSAGNFSISLKKLPDTIFFRLMGYAMQQIVADGKTSFYNVKLEVATTQLNEVVVSTGYQQLKPNEVTGVIANIDVAGLEQRTGTNILDRLLGQSTGLLRNIGKANNNPQSSIGISVRGLGTIKGPLDPLVVLDGFIYEGDINNINPNDIANVSILKDAAAASIWGARAGNGVIVISTHKAKFGNQLKINASATATISQLPNFNGLNQMNAADYIGVEQLLFDRGYFNDQIASSPHSALSPVVELLLRQRQGTLSEAEVKQQLARLANGNSNQAYLKEFYEHGLTQQYAISLSSGTNKFANIISAAYDRASNESAAKSDRLNLKMGFDYKPIPKLSLGANAYLTYANNETGMPTVNSLRPAGKLLPYLSFRDEAGNALPMDYSYRSAYTDTLLGGRLLDWKYYPTEEYKLRKTTSQRQEISANFSASYQLLKFLSLNLSYQLQQQDLDRQTIADAQSYNARNMVNLFTQYDKVTNSLKYIVPKGGIRDDQFASTSSNTLRMQANFNHSTNNHSFNGIMGAEQRAVNNQSLGSIKYGYYADPLNFREVDPVNAYPTILTGNTRQINGAGGMTATHYRFVSFYANIAYTYLQRYQISASVRNDGSNIFGAKTNDRWKPLWSAGANWKLSEESFYQLSWLPKLGLRATFGYSGNVDLSKTALPVAVYGTNPVTGLPMTVVTAINNPSLKWEKIAQLNVGVDFATKGNVLSGSLAYFIKNGTDLYGLAPYDYTGWGAVPQLVRNIAAMRGRGLEAELHLNLIRNAQLSWQADAFLNYNVAKTTKYFAPNNLGMFNLLGSGQSINPLEGQHLYAIAAYKWAGLDEQGNPQGFVNGMPSTDYVAIANEATTSGANISLIGPASPTHYGALNNKLSYKQFALQVNISYRLGYYAKKSTISYSNLVNNGSGHSDFGLRWQQPGDENSTSVPSFVYPVNMDRDNFYSLASVNAYKADNVRLDNISLSYKLQRREDASFLNRMELFLNLQNVAVIWKATDKAADPDYEGGIPPIRTLSLGLKTSF